MNPDQVLGEGLQIKCPACLQVFMAYEDGSTSSIESTEEDGTDVAAAESLLPPPPPPPPRAPQASAPPPIPSGSTADSDVFDFSFGSAAEPTNNDELPTVDPVEKTNEDAFDFSFGLEAKADSSSVAAPASTSPLGNLFDDLDDLPQPKTADAELPAPKGIVDLPGIKSEAVEIDSPMEVEDDSSLGLQAPEAGEPDVPPAVPAPTPVAPMTVAAGTEEKRSGALYLLLGGIIFFGVVCSALYFGGLLEPENSEVPLKPVVIKKTIPKKPTVVVKPSKNTLAQVAGFMDKLEQLELGLTEEDPKTQKELNLYFGLSALQFPDQKYFQQKVQKLAAGLGKDDQDVSSLALMLANQDVKASELISTSLKKSPNNAVLNLLMGYQSERVGELSAAIRYFNKAFTRNPAFLQAVRKMSEIEIRRGSYDKAETLVAQLEEKIPTSFPGLFLRARLEYERPNGNLEQAKAALEQIIKLPAGNVRQSDRALTLELTAKILRRGGDVDKAIEALSTAARLDNRNAELLGLLGELYFEKNEYDRALKQIRQLEKDGKASPELLVLKADCFYRMSQQKKALSIINEAKAKYPTAPNVLLYEGDLLKETRSYDLAEAAYKKAIELRPFEVSTQLKLAKLLMAQSKIEEAKELLESKIKSNPNSAELLIGYAQMRKQLGDIGGGKTDYLPAKVHYEKALQLNASSVSARLELVDVLVQLQESTLAKAELARVMESEHLKHRISYLNARILAQGDQHADALNAFEQSEQSYKNDSEFLVRMARSAFFSGAHTRAMTLLDQARRLDNKRPETYHFMGRTAFEKKDYGLAIRHLTQALKLDGQSTNHRYWLARSYVERQELDKARKEYDRVIRQTKTSAKLSVVECDTLFRRALMLREEGLPSWARAVRELDRHVSCNGDNAKAYFVRGQIRADYKEFDSATSDFKRAANLAGGQGLSRIQAQALYESSRVLKRRKRFSEEKLVELLNDSVDADDSYAPPRRDLCDLLQQSDKRTAKRHCQAYLRAAPNGVYAQQVREVLRNL